MKVLVIGGAGYIGSHVVKELMKKGHTVAVFDNLSSGLRENLFEQNEFHYGNILLQGDLDAVFSLGFDAFIHLAAFKAAGESMTSPEKYSTNNIAGTINILNCAVRHNCKRMVFSSSAAIFGAPSYLPIDENHPKHPENYYGFTKLNIEMLLDWYETLRDLKFASLRYFNAAGYDVEGFPKGLEINPANLLPVIMETAFGKRAKMQIFGTDYDTRDGTCVRDYVHVTDLARAHVLALDYICEKERSLKVNLGSEKGVTVKEMVEAARRITGREIPADYAGRRAGDPASIVASSSFAREILGWNAEYSDVDTLIKTTARAYEAAYAKK